MDDLDNSPKQVDRFSVVAAVLRLDQIGNLLEMLGKGRPWDVPVPLQGMGRTWLSRQVWKKTMAMGGLHERTQGLLQEL